MAKFCVNCGKPLGDAVRFCVSCGAQQQSAPPQPPPPQAQPYIQPQQPFAPAAPKPKSKMPLAIGIAGGALVLVFVVIAIVANTVGPGGDMAKLPTGEDLVSMNALVGSWFYDNGWGRAYLWKFDEKGNYARFIVSQTGYTNDVGTNWYSAYGNIMTGNYRVNGYVISLYNNRHSSQFSQDFNIGVVLPHNTAVDKLPPLSDPSPVVDLTMEFEFTDATTLRLASARPLYDDYDVEFDYWGEDSHDVPMPTHTIPSRKWPEVFAKANIPEYGDGRIRDVRERMNGDRLSEILVEIDWSTPEYFDGFIERLVENGWSLDNKWRDYDYTYEKGEYNVSINMYHRDKKSGENIYPGRFVYITLWTTWGDINNLKNN